MSVKEHSFSEARDIEFFEHVFPFLKPMNGSASIPLNDVNTSPSFPGSSYIQNEHVVEQELRRSKRQRTEKSFILIL